TSLPQRRREADGARGRRGAAAGRRRAREARPLRREGLPRRALQRGPLPARDLLNPGRKDSHVKATVAALATAASAKAELSRRSPLQYLVLSALAGAYIGIGIVLIFAIG